MGIFDNEKEEKEWNEDYEMLAWENKRMAKFLLRLGIGNEEIGELVINGTDHQFEQALNIVVKNIREG